MNSVQKAGGIFSLVTLSPSVGTYACGMFTGNVPIRVVQPTSHTNNSIDLPTATYRRWNMISLGSSRKVNAASVKDRLPYLV